MIDSTKILAGLPAGLRDPLLQSYQEIARNYMEHRWEPSELNGGKFSEAIYSIIEGSVKGKFAVKPTKPKDMVKACRDLEGLPADSSRVGDRSLRVLIPRVIQSLYEIRNNRGVGHLGGDVDPNFLDATAVYEMASWILAEIVRIFHAISTKEAQEIVNELVERKHPLIWEVEGVKRVLDPKMSKTDQTLLLLYSKPAWVAEKDLYQWVEYSTLSMFRKHILIPAHDSRLIEYDQSQGHARISPLGSTEVEQRIIKTRI
jgi:hypothetical protein